jgi:hypothetical protein
VNDAALDPDGDGTTNLQEYQAGTDPHDYFNGGAVNLAITGGDGQRATPASWLTQPLEVQVTTATGTPMVNAPVIFSVTQTGGFLSATNGGASATSISVRTDVFGKAVAYYQTPNAALLETVTATTGSGANIRQATFVASTTDNAFPFVGLKVWLRSDGNIIKDANNAISQWLDESGNGNNAVQNSTPSSPVYTANALNGHAVVRFDGADDSLTLPNFASSFTEGEVFVVLKSRGPTDGQTNTLWVMGDDYIWAPDTYPGGDGTVYETFGTRSQRATGIPSQPLDQFHLYNISSKAAEYVTRINGREHYKSISNTVFFPSAPVLGGGVYSGHRFGGDIAEVLIFNRVLTATERSAMGLYLNQKYFYVASPPPAPAQLHAWALGGNQVSLSWINPVSNSVSYFDVQRRGSSGVF